MMTAQDSNVIESPSPRLNPTQLMAVEAVDGPVLVLAGAGSGKTRVLTFRIAHLIESGTAMPGEICSLTFTNKAARVMKERIEKIFLGRDVPVQDLWVSTFHSMGAKLLRLYGQSIGIDPRFTIYDDSDQLALIKDLMEIHGLSDKVVSPKTILYRIGSLKNDGQNPADFRPVAQSFLDVKMAPVIRDYDAALKKNNALDFGDLIFRTLELFQKDQEFRDFFQERYRYILVDEYQDTNGSQYKLLRLMTEKYRNLCVVGDEDQSIYGWRGADIRNILDFEKDFPDAKIIKLEENYRSTAHIVRAANKVVANNSQRKEKVLFTSNASGDPVEVHFLENDFEEARWIVRRINHLSRSGNDLKEMAIFYRTHAQSRLFEDQLRYERISYKIFGGVRFYDRAEIKDALAYLRLFVNSRDEVSMLRIINVPARGIGRTTLDKVREAAFKDNLPLLEALGMCASGQLADIGSGPKKKLQSFLDLFGKLQIEMGKMSPVEFYAYVLDESGYLKALENENSTESQARLENLKELGTVIREYETRNKEATLTGFLEEIALVTDADRVEASEDFVSLMTIHAAKGLEFENVFVGGLEEELFPHVRQDRSGSKESDDIEEERRLCYVAMTRARKRLFLCSARSRRVFGISHYRNPSRFLSELPTADIQVHDHAPMVAPRPGSFKSQQWASQNNFATPPFSDDLGGGWGDPDEFSDAPSGPKKSSSFLNSASQNSGWSVGVKVAHPDYGQGVIVRCEGQNESLKVTVQFPKFGSKKFVVRFAPLERLPN